MKDLSDFLSEKKDNTKPHVAKEDEGTDDKKYLALASDYKIARQSNQGSAKRLFKQMEKLVKSGDVSAKVKLAVAYL